RRKLIEREANFYGAMDGASRFVKGDAIAGIIIILIDIIGGLAIGISQMGLGWGQALQTYTLLTVGDGIVTQVPALIIATGTGIIVTRAATDAQLSDEISRQVTAYPKTILLVAIGLFAVMLMPGIPLLPVLLLLVVAGLLYFFALRSPSRQAAKTVETAKKGESESEDLYELLVVEPIEISVGQNLIPIAADNALFMERIVAFRKQFALEAGLVFPKVRVRDDRKLGPNHYEVAIYGTKVAEGSVLADRFLAINANGEQGSLEGMATKDPTYGLPAVWIVDEQRWRAREAGYTVVDPATVLLTHVTEVIKLQSPNLLTRAETERIVARVRERHASLVEELIPKVLSLGEVQKVLQGLLREKVSIRNVEAILEVLSDFGARNRDPEYLTEQVRERVGAMICHSLATPEGELYVLTFDPSVEQAISGAIRSIEEKPTLVLEPKFAEQLLRRLAAEVERMMSSNLMPVVLCSPALRRHVRRFTERVMPQVSVLSLSEVPNGVNLKSFGMVSV
ncbi:MAG TPA: flagellar biosynthesis protein FlhA, partial [Burkholderiales bacterium]